MPRVEAAMNELAEKWTPRSRKTPAPASAAAPVQIAEMCKAPLTEITEPLRKSLLDALLSGSQSPIQRSRSTGRNGPRSLVVRRRLLCERGASPLSLA